MNILGHEYITEQMPDGWVICERCFDGVLNVIVNEIFNSERAAHSKLKNLASDLPRESPNKRFSAKRYRQCQN